MYYNQICYYGIEYYSLFLKSAYCCLSKLKKFVIFNKMNLKLNRLQHIGIPVTNLVQSENFYKKLGFKMVMNATFMQGAGQGLVSMMQHQEIIIELYQMPEPELSNIKTRVDGRKD